eukprot:g4935.t1
MGSAAEVRRSHALGWASLLASVCFLVGMGLLLLFLYDALEHVRDQRPLLLVGAGSALCAVVPLTHYFGGSLEHGSRGWSWFQPLRGGVRFVVFQAVSWTFFALSMLMTSVPALFWVFGLLYPVAALKVLAVCAGAAALLSEVAMLTSLSFFHAAPATAPAPMGGPHRVLTSVPARVGLLRSSAAHAIGADAWARRVPGGVLIFVLMQLVLAAAGLIVAVIGTNDAYWVPPPHFQQLPSLTEAGAFGCVAEVLLVTSLFFFKGKAEGGAKRGQDGGTASKPEAGGGGAGAACAAADAPHRSGVLRRKLALYPAGVGIARGAHGVRGARAIAAPGRWPWFVRLVWATSVYNLQFFVFAAMFVSAYVAPRVPLTVVGSWIVGFLTYPTTFFGAPSRSGRRRWQSIPCGAAMNELAAYFELQVICAFGYGPALTENECAGEGEGVSEGEGAGEGEREGDGENVGAKRAAGTTAGVESEKAAAVAGPSRKQIFGFHPHDILPFDCAISPNTNAWHEAEALAAAHAGRSPAGGRSEEDDPSEKSRSDAGDERQRLPPSVLSSSILHTAPLMRDVNQWAGGFDVSSRGFDAGLDVARRVMLVPGGQREMMYSSSRDDVVPLNTRHKGFVRKALQHGADLVPMYSFGLTRVLDNAAGWFVPRAWQASSMAALRANVFFLPVGLGDVLPCPRPARLRLVVGAALRVPRVRAECLPGGAGDLDRLLRLLHALYFTRLQRLHRDWRGVCGYGAQRLSMRPELPAAWRGAAGEALLEAEWHVARAEAEAAMAAAAARSGPTHTHTHAHTHTHTHTSSAKRGPNATAGAAGAQERPPSTLAQAMNEMLELMWAACFFLIVFAICAYRASLGL